jgi:two-component system cell cycle sensor histidine kinase/response regulator CckA
MDSKLFITLLDSLAEPTVVLDDSGVVIEASESFARLLGTSRDHLRGMEGAVFSPSLAHGVQGASERSVEFRTFNGRSVSVKLAVHEGPPVVVRVLASFSDDELTHVFHNQRLETLGILAGGVAHDFNNILTGMLGHLAYLRSILPASGGHVESLQSIEEGAVRAASMTQQIVNFSRLKPSGESTKVEVCDVISRLCSLMRGAIPAEVELRWRPPSEPVYLLGTEAHICQVVINLVVNARDAISGKGFIEVLVEPRAAEDDIRAIFGDEPPAEAYGAVLVRDNGSGMSDEVKRRLFEPYFTTKADHGTGLGLATVHSIVRGLGGAIVVESSTGEGTTFRIVVPVVRDLEKKEPAQLGAQHPMRGNGERILVIDDEYAVRNVLGLSLSHLGYSLDTAASGLEGLEKYAESGASYDLVILDLLMPGLSGEEVFARLKRQNPGVKVLLVSGFSSETVVRRLLDAGGQGFIQKPFAIEILAAKVHGCIHG